MSDEPFRVLLSYHYYRRHSLGPLLDELFGAGHRLDVFADSGAYSAMTQGAPVKLGEYADWITANADQLTVYANLDVIGDDKVSAEGSWANQRRLEDEHGLHPLPVFHVGEPWSALERLLDHGYRYVALGGLVGRPRPTVMPWLVRCFRMAEGRAALHGFGVSSWEAMAALPWYSVDSSSWGAGFRYGQLQLFDRHRWLRVSMFDHTSVYRAAHLFRRYGFDPAVFADRKRYSHQLAAVVSARSWRSAQAYLRARHGSVTIPGSVDGEPGLRWYCVDGSISNLADAAEGLRLHLVTDVPDLKRLTHHSAAQPKGATT